MTTRRLQLWVKQSVVHVVSSETKFEVTGNTEGESNELTSYVRNIDEAMEALHPHDVDHLQSPHRQEDYDWILDNDREHEEECKKSQELLRQLNYSESESAVASSTMELHFAALHELYKSESSFEDEQLEKRKNKEEIDTEIVLEDDDSFGDFQEAVGEQHEDPHVNAPQHHDIVIPLDELPSTNIEQSLPMEEPSSEKNLDFTQPQQQQQNNHQQHSKHNILEVYKSIPLTDLASPEGKFLRWHISESCTVDSKQVKKDAIHDIPIMFFDDIDDTLLVLQSIPWEHVPIWQNMDDVDMLVVENYISHHLSMLDSFQSQVTKVLLEGICELQPKLEEGNQLVHDMDINLRLAKSFVNLSRKALEAATGREEDFTGLLGGQSLMHMWDQMDLFTDLDTLLRTCSEVLEKEHHIMQQISSFGVDNSDFRQILDAAEELRTVTSKPLKGGISQLLCLNPLQKRACAILGTFRERIEIALQDHMAQACASWKNFSGEHYRTLLLATLEVHKHQLDQVDEMGIETDDSSVPPINIAEAWSSCILDTLAFEVSKCFSRALLDPVGDTTDSEYDTDLMNLAFELQRGFGDYAKLKTISHNLVTIRFDFEADKNYFPSVYERLCTLLTDVLHTHVIITAWHEEYQFEVSFREVLRDMKLQLWNCCEQVLMSCLSSFHDFSSKKVLFPEKGNWRNWLVDLEGLHDILQLSNQFLSLGNEFLDTAQLAETSITALSSGNVASELYAKLCMVFRLHLRSVHVEAMNSIGMMLSKESWHLVPLRASCEGLDVASMIKAELIRAITASANQSRKRRRWMNRFYHSDDVNARKLQAIKSSGNPFLCEATINDAIGILDKGYIAAERLLDQMLSSSDLSSSVFNLHHLLEQMIDGSGMHRFSSACAVNELVTWTSKILVLSHLLPIIAVDVAQVLQSLCDLYFITVFRLCVGNASCERLVLGIDSVQPYITPQTTESTASTKGSDSNFFGLRSPRAKRPTSLPPFVSPNLIAEMCAPRANDMPTISRLRTFIEKGQSNLSGIVNLERIENWMPDPVRVLNDDSNGDEWTCRVSGVLERRQGAAWSCVFVAALLNLSCSFIESTSTHAYLERLLGLCQDEEKKDEEAGPPKCFVELKPFSLHAESAIEVIPTLVDVASRVAAMKAIMGRQIVYGISKLESKWSASRLNEHSNDYVDELCDRYVGLWQFLSTSGKLPLGVRHSTWEQLISAGFLAILEGFARVSYCSTEGRSLMSMDLGAFASGLSPRSIAERMDLDGFDKPPCVLPTRGRQYVDTYIKAFYLPDDDVMTWITSNYQNYPLNHCLSLIANKNGRQTSASPEILMQSVKLLYKVR